MIANQSIGQLDKALDEANAKGWTVVRYEERLATRLSLRVKTAAHPGFGRQSGSPRCIPSSAIYLRLIRSAESR